MKNITKKNWQYRSLKNYLGVSNTIAIILMMSMIACGTSGDSDSFPELDFLLELKSNGILSLEKGTILKS